MNKDRKLEQVMAGVNIACTLPERHQSQMAKLLKTSDLLSSSWLLSFSSWPVLGEPCIRVLPSLSRDHMGLAKVTQRCLELCTLE